MPERAAEHTETKERDGENAEEQDRTETGPYWHPMENTVHNDMENTVHNDAADNGNPQGFRLAGDKPAQKMSLKEKLAAFKAKSAGMENQEKQREKWKETTR